MGKMEALRHSSSEDMVAFASPCCRVHMSSTCHTLHRELEQIRRDIGETEAHKDRMLLEPKRECSEVYQRKVKETINTLAVSINLLQPNNPTANLNGCSL